MNVFQSINQTQLIGLSCLLASGLIQLVYYLYLYRSIARRQSAACKGAVAFNDECPPLSVVICAHNASHALRQNLPSILEQDYPQFEVIVVNDDSSDETDDTLTLLENQYPHLYHTFTPDSARYISRKKLAITVGIKASKYDWLVLTEPECRPASRHWLRHMARNFTPDTDLVLGHSRYLPEKGWFQQKVSFDNLFLAMRYLGMALIGHPYMGIGRNLAYRKKLFFDNKGFSTHLNLQRGDDDLFVNETATTTNTRVETAAESVVETTPIRYRKEWRQEKLNYMVTSHFYRGWQRYLLGAETATRLAFYGSALFLIAYSLFQASWLPAAIALLAFLIRFGVQVYVFHQVGNTLGERIFRFSLPVFDVLQPITSLKFKFIRRFSHQHDFLRK